MDSCVLCLELNKDILDTIKATSTEWQEYNIDKVIEKYFWPLNTIQTSSWICLSCWKEVDDFHKFYMRIEEAHMNFGKIKVEDIAATTGEMTDKNNFAFCFLEPEITINSPQPQDLIVDKESSSTESLYETDLYDVPSKSAIRSLILQNDLASEDPLQKSCKTKTNKGRDKKNSKTKASLERKLVEGNKREESKIKIQPTDYNENDNSYSFGDSDNDNRDSQCDRDISETVESTTRKVYAKHRPNREENDKFIGDHFKMFCDLCQAPLKDFYDMQEHFSENHNQKGYVVCCKRKYFARSGLVDHLHSHLNPDYFKCKECGKTLSNRINFESHMLRVHRANEVVKMHCCDKCDRSFAEAYALRNHKFTHLSEKEKKIPCLDCGKNYGSTYLLNQHRKVAHLKHFVKICYICGKATKTSAEFRMHMNMHEGIPPPIFNCDVCGLRLINERGLKAHKKSQHPVGGKREHPCPMCEKVSITAKALRSHIATMHERGYDHKCDMCEKAFRRAISLKEHIASQHTGATLYTCPWCPMTFTSNANMNAHRKKVHPMESLELKLKRYTGLNVKCMYSSGINM